MFNCQAYLGSVIDSVRRQTLEDWELVLFDDGSRDQTLSIAREYAASDGRIRVCEGPNGGTARARNRGFAASTPGSEFVIFLDNDDVWEPDALETLMRALEEEPTAPAAYGLARGIDPTGRQFAGDDLSASMVRRRALRNGVVADLPIDAPATYEALVLENYPVTPGTTLIRRAIRNKVGDYVPETVPCDDWDMHLRVSRHGGLLFVNRVILNWRRYPGAASYNTARWRDAYLRVRSRSVQSPENDAYQRGVAIAAFRLACRNARLEAVREVRGRRLQRAVRATLRWALFQLAYGQVMAQPFLNGLPTVRTRSS
jgi:glycosyltransferase involved in cell wall biosynthesis